MNKHDKLNDIFNHFYYKGLQKFIKENDNKYGIEVFKQQPATALPLCITTEMNNKSLLYEDISRTDPTYSFRIKVEVFAQKQGSVLGRDIAQYYESLVCEYLDSTGIRYINSVSIPNLDTNIHRIMIVYSGTYSFSTNMIGRSY